MSELDYALCPRCYIEAKGNKQVIEFFGLRNMGNSVIRVQSHCRECRKESVREIRLRAKRKSK